MHLTLSDRQCSQALARRLSALAAAGLKLDFEAAVERIVPESDLVTPTPKVPPIVFVPEAEATTGIGWELAVILGS